MKHSISPVLVIAENTFRELIRDRILYGIVVFAVLLFGLSLVLGQLTFAEQSRISADFGFSAIQLSAAVMAVFVGGTLVSREIEKKTILTLLVRPINRTQFLIGKSLGLLAVVLVSSLALAGVLALILWPMGILPNGFFALALFGVLLEAAVLLALTLFFGSFSSPMLAISFVVGIFLIGHSIGSLKYFIDKSDSATFQIFGQTLVAITPNFDIFNWRANFIYSDAVAGGEVAAALVYALAWSTLLICASSLILNRRDLG